MVSMQTGMFTFVICYIHLEKQARCEVRWLLRHSTEKKVLDDGRA